MMRCSERHKTLCTTGPCHQSNDLIIHQVLFIYQGAQYITYLLYPVLGSNQYECYDHFKGCFLDILIVIDYVSLLQIMIL